MISFKDFLTELFDKPWKMEHDPEMEDHVRQHFNTFPTYKDHKFGAVKVHKLEGNNGHLVHVVRNGFHEIHHIAADTSSGDEGPKLSTPNPKFISTAFHYAKKLLDNDRTVKISATEKMHPHIKPIIDRLAKKHGYDVEHGSEQIGEHTVPFSKIKRKLQEHFMFGGIESHLIGTRK